MTTASISPLDIQSHLYSSFLNASTADVALRVVGSWSAVYQLHRVVLIQSDFFRSLFTSEFREGSQVSRNRRRGADEINIVFDDTNITRAAFEICLSRLYGGGPPLYLPPSLVPSISQPLSPSHATGLLPETIPEAHHPATPRFLLSLLATSIYLSIPTVASQALSMIFKTIGPYTVIPYLNFALGKSIDHGSHHWPDPEAAVGLEHIAELLDNQAVLPPLGHDLVDITSKVSSISFKEKDGFLNPTATLEGTEESDDESEPGSSHHYGPISDKIGEACSCWLVRWASDMLSSELTDQPSDSVSHHRKPVIWRRGGLDPLWVCALISADTFFVKDERARYDFAKAVVEMRRKGGIIETEERQWTVVFEDGIYYTNMTVEDIIGISRDVSPTTNKPYVSLSVLQNALWNHSLFRHQITYRPRGSPGQAASPPPRDKELGLAISTQELKVRENNTGQYYYPVLGDSSLRMGDNGSDNPVHPDGGAISMEDIFHFSHSPAVSLARQSTSRTGSSHHVPTDTDVKVFASEETVFGLRGERYTAEECISTDPTGKRRWSPFPPQRFGVEFWDIDSLKEKSRLHSHTVWYAGSLFNIYIQIVRKKGQPQLGIYLHRQSSIEPIPSPSAPCPSLSRSSVEEDTKTGEGHTIVTRPRGSTVLGPILSGIVTPSSPALHSSRSLNGLSRVQTAPVASSIPSSSTPSPSPASNTYETQTSASIIPFTTPGLTPVQPYRDPRASVSAYFSISCASATGSSQMRFTSAPDVFSVSQSWGWKTSALRTEEYMEIRNEDTADSANRSPIKSLRATVVMGLI